MDSTKITNQEDSKFSYSGSDITPFIIYHGEDTEDVTNLFSKGKTHLGHSIVRELTDLMDVSISMHVDIATDKAAGTNSSIIVRSNTVIAGSLVFNVSKNRPLLDVVRAYQDYLTSLSVSHTMHAKKPEWKKTLADRYNRNKEAISMFGEASDPFVTPHTVSIPPFDLILMFNNETDTLEYTDSSKKKQQTVAILKKIIFVDVGYHVSIDNTSTELVGQFLAGNFFEPMPIDYILNNGEIFQNSSIFAQYNNFIGPNSVGIAADIDSIQKIRYLQKLKSLNINPALVAK